MKKKMATRLVGGFLLACLLLVGYHNVTRPRVLVLHSYDPEFSWVQGLDTSFRQALHDLHRPMLKRWHYMSLRGAPGAQFTETAAASARRAVSQFEPNILVVFDDLAAELVTPALLDQPGLTIVYAGIDEPLAHHAFDKASNVAGLMERIPVEAFRDAVGHLGRGRAMTVGCLGDARALADAEVAQLQELDWRPHTLLPCEQSDNFPDWQARVDRISREADVLFISGYRGLHRAPDSTEVVPPSEVATWTEAHSAALTMAAKITFVPDGGAMAITPSPQEHGQAAGRIVGQILRGVAPKDIPPAEGKAFVVSVDSQRLRRHGYVLPPVYEAAARALGNYR